MLIMPSISSVFFTSSLSLFLRWPFIRVAQRQRLCKRPPRGLCSRSSISQDYGQHGYWVLFTALQRLHTHTHLTALCPGLPGWAGTRKVKPIWILLKQETVSGSGISWAIYASLHLAPDRKPRQHPTTQFFYRPDALPAAQPTASKHWRPTLHWLMIQKPVQSRSVELLHGRDWKNPGGHAPLHSAKQTDETPLVKICNHPK